MSRSIFSSHILPAAASSAIAGAVNYGFLGHSFRGAGVGALAGLFYSATHDILKTKSENGFINHSFAILTSVLLTYGISKAAAAAGLIAAPTLAGFGALVGSAILVNLITRLIFKPRTPEPVSAKPKLSQLPPQQASAKHFDSVRLEPVQPGPEPLGHVLPGHVNIEPQQNQRPLLPVVNPVPVQPKTIVPSTPPAAQPREAHVKAEPQKTTPPDQPKAAAEKPPEPPSQAAEKPGSVLAPQAPNNKATPSLKEFVASQDFQNCTNWLTDLKNIEDNKWIHNRDGRYVITGGGASFLPFAQTAVSWRNKHTPEQLAQDLQNSTEIFARTLPELITLHNNIQEKAAVRVEIEKIRLCNKEALRKLHSLKKTYQDSPKVLLAIQNLMNTLEQNQRVFNNAIRLA